MNGIRKKRLWFFDFDGTLSPIVHERSEARIHPACMALLGELVETPCSRVAVVSSRSLDDLIFRVGVSGVYLGGGSGVEWYVEGENRRIADEGMVKRLKVAREHLLPQIKRFALPPGVDLEDKKWSIAIHTRKCYEEARRQVAAALEAWNHSQSVRMFKGPEVIEIQFLHEVDKAFGVRALCKMLGVDPTDGEIIYAGDDENDAVAIRWVLKHGGIAFTVGKGLIIPGARVVEDPPALGREVRRLFGEGEKNGLETGSCTTLK